MISGCSGRRRKRELGIAAPSPFPYFLSTGPRLHPAGEGPRAPPPTARQCAPGGARAGRCRLWRHPPLPPPRAAVPLGTDSRAGPRSRPWRRPELGHSGTRSSPGAPARRPSLASASAAGGGAGSPRKPDRRPPPARRPRGAAGAWALRPLGPRDLSPPASPAGAASLAAASGSLGPRKPRLCRLPDVRRPQHGLQAPGPTVPASTRGPRVSRSRLPRPAVGLQGRTLHPAKSSLQAATCLRLG